MARQTALSTLVSLLKAETGKSLTIGTQQDATFKQLFANVQNWLAGAHDWPFLSDHWDVQMGVGTRVHAVPTSSYNGGTANTYTINFERPVVPRLKWGQHWYPVEWEIGVGEMNVWDSDRTETGTPIQRIKMINADRFEVWPIPSEAQTLRFEAQRNVAALAVDADKADLDDLLLVYFCAADVLAKEGSRNAQISLTKATQRLAQLQASYPVRSARYILGSSGVREQVRINPIKIVAVA